MANRHLPGDLKQYQSLPLEAKIILTQERIRTWYESWTRFEIFNEETGKTRYVTMDTRDFFAQPEMKDCEYLNGVFPGSVYVSFSGGKDSTVLKHIVDSMYDDVPSLFVNTGLEYPEIQRFAKSQKNVVTVRPEMRFDEVIKNYGYPAISKEVAHKLHDANTARKNGNFDSYAERQFNGTYISSTGKTNAYSIEKWRYLLDAPFDVSHKCCDVMKKRPAKLYEKQTGRVPFIGTLADESKLRRQNWLKHGCNAFDMKRPSSQPLSFWTEQDILHYLKKYDVPYCSVYGDIVADDGTFQFDGQLTTFDVMNEYEGTNLKTTGCARTGRIFCMFGCHLEGTPNRFHKLKETHPRQYDYCINGGEYVDGKLQPNKTGLGLGKVLDYIGVEY